ncbi:MAG: InlB B-repeat-containing protein, partial [Paludibacteraceae bacterium]|nr:InlB B-repeat-containing protein [Paludibacteraceae bacterium]
TVVATAANDYAFSSWSVTGNATGTSSTNTYTLKGNGSVGTGTLTANFTLVPCKLYKLSAAKNGSTTDKGAMSYDPTEHAYYKDITTDASPYYFRFYYNNIAQYCTNWSSTSGGDAYTSGKQIAANGSKVDCNQSVGGWTDKPAMYYSGESGTTIRIWFDYQNKKTWITADKDKQYVLRGANSDNDAVLDGMPGWDATTSYFVGLASGNTGTYEATLNGAEWYKLKAYDMYNKTWYGTTGSDAELIDGTLSTMGSGGNFYFGTTVDGTYTFTLDKSSGTKIKVDYPVSYQLNYSIGSVAGTEGSITTSPSTTSGSYVRSGNVVTLTAPNEKTGYSWDGWYLNEAGTGDKQCATKAYAVTMNETKTLYACYTQDDYTITLNGNSGTGHTASVTAHYGEFAPVDDGVGGHKFSITNPDRDGYTFAGWYTNSDGTGTMLINPNGYLTWSIDGFTDGTGKWIATSGTNLYARWKTNASVGKYNFQYGSGTWYSSSWTLMNFGDADDHERTIDFTLIDPTSKKFFVGYDGDFQADHIGDGTGASSEENFSDLRLAPGTLSVGSAIGATGKLVIFDNSSEENLYVGFKPNGYGLTYVGGTKAFSEVSDHLWQTDIVTLTASDVAGSFKVGLLSATPGSYVDCSTMTATDNAAALNTRKNALVTEQSYPAIPNLAAGQEGRFVIWDNDSHAGQQWYLCFLPVYSITYNDNGASSGSVPVDANKYRTNETPTVLGNSGSLAKEGYAFSGWNTAADGRGTAYTVGSNLEAIGDNVILYAQYRKAEITDVVLNAGIFEPVEAGDPETYVTADPTLDPTPAPTIKLCWELRYSNDNPVTGHDPISVSGNQVKFLLNGLAAGGYKIHVELRTGSTCGAGELLSSFDKSFSIASDHIVTVQYKCGDFTLKAPTSVGGKPLDWSEVIEAASITGYTFNHWEAGEGVTIKDDEGEDKTTSTDATIQIKAIYDSKL